MSVLPWMASLTALCVASEPDYKGISWLKFKSNYNVLLPANGNAPTSSCATFNQTVAVPTSTTDHLRAPGLNLVGAGQGWDLNTIFYGVGGHRTALDVCVFREPEPSSSFGWSWVRGATDPTCQCPADPACQLPSDPPPACLAPACYYDMSWAGVAYGVNAGNVCDHTRPPPPPGHEFPVDLTAYKSFTVSHNISYKWVDDAPGVSPPELGSNYSRRTRFLYDLFLTSEKPNGTIPGPFITDELIIDLNCNPHFPGSQPPGCIDPYNPGSTAGPVERNAVWDGYHWYDYWYTDNHDVCPGTGSSYSSFRRVGAEGTGNSPTPQHVNLVPFLEHVRQRWPGTVHGPWLGMLSIGTELYDHNHGRVVFESPPTFAREHHGKPEHNVHGSTDSSSKLGTTVPTIKLNNGVGMPMISFGTWQYNSSMAEAVVKLALKVGFNHIDAAHDYGNQRGVGQALKQVDRSSYFLTTKVPNNTYQGTKDHLQIDLDQLGLEFVDLMLVHYPMSNNCKQMQDQWRAMEEFYNAGKAKAIGVSNFCISSLKCILQTATVMPAVNQVEFHVGMGTDPEGLKSYCDSNGIRIQAYSPLGDGTSELTTGPLVTGIGTAHNVSGAQVSLRWLIQSGVPLSTKTTKESHMQEDLHIFGFSLQDMEKLQLDNATSPSGTPSFMCSSERTGPTLML